MGARGAGRKNNLQPPSEVSACFLFIPGSRTQHLQHVVDLLTSCEFWKLLSAPPPPFLSFSKQADLRNRGQALSQRRSSLWGPQRGAAVLPGAEESGARLWRSASPSSPPALSVLDVRRLRSGTARNALSLQVLFGGNSTAGVTLPWASQNQLLNWTSSRPTRGDLEAGGTMPRLCRAPRGRPSRPHEERGGLCAHALTCTSFRRS